MKNNDGSRPPTIVVGVVAYNNEDTIAKIVLESKQFSNQVMVCDDGSSDMTGEIAEALGSKVLTHPENLGEASSLRSLFLAASKLEPDVFVTMDASGRYNTQEMLKIITPVLNGECDIAIGSRTGEKSHDSHEPVILNLTVLTSTGMPVKDLESLYRAYGRAVFEKVKPPRESEGPFSKLVLQMATQEGLKISEFETASSTGSKKEGEGKTPLSSSSGLRSSILGISDLVSTKHPLLFYGIPAIAFFATALYQAWLTAYALNACSFQCVPDFGILFMMALFILAIVFSVTGTILHSISRSSSNKGRIVVG